MRSRDQTAARKPAGGGAVWIAMSDRAMPPAGSDSGSTGGSDSQGHIWAETIRAHGRRFGIGGSPVSDSLDKSEATAPGAATARL